LEAFVKAVLALILLVTSSSAQNLSETRRPARYPHPYVETGLSFADAVTPSFHAGIDLEQRHLLINTGVSYANDRKTHDATDGNVKGRARSVQGSAFYKFQTWHLGGGFAFGQQATTNYTKEGRHFMLGGGKDILRDGFSMRARALYLPALSLNEQTFYPDGRSCKCNNEGQGVDLGLWMPSPATAHHVFLHIDLTTEVFHDTVTDPTNLAMTRAQSARHAIMTWMDVSILYRF
jgi:hypothetical protein